MQVDVPPEFEARLRDCAAWQGRSPEEVLCDAINQYLLGEARFVEAVMRGEEQLRRGEYLTHEQVERRLERFLKP